ncbi:MAG: serine/threonine protein kinase [Comamonadaceae bacterium]|nr:serine/threonine protein kinase [Comamonadaceae bacterium]
MEDIPSPPFATLTPDCVLAALDSVGLRGDGRLLALNSYENRVYQVGMRGRAAGLVAKFYRPGRWTDARHPRGARLRARTRRARDPGGRAAARSAARTLHSSRRLPLRRLSRGAAAARPELERPGHAANGWAASSARIHAVGALQPFRAPAGARPSRASATSRATICWRTASIPADLRRRVAQRRGAGARRRAALLRPRRRRARSCGCTATATPGNVLWTARPARTSSTSTTARMGPAVQDLWMLLSGDRAEHDAASSPTCWRGYEDFREFDPRELHLVEALRTLRLIHYSAWLARRWDDPAFPAAFPWFNTPALLAGPHPRTARAGRADGRAAAVAGVTSTGRRAARERSARRAVEHPDNRLDADRAIT